MRQNAHAIHAIQERLEAARSVPVEALTEIAREGTANFIAAQRVLFNLAQRENEILLGAAQERTARSKTLTALTETVRRGLDTFIDMQLRFLTLAAKLVIRPLRTRPTCPRRSSRASFRNTQHADRQAGIDGRTAA